MSDLSFPASLDLKIRVKELLETACVKATCRIEIGDQGPRVHVVCLASDMVTVESILQATGLRDSVVLSHG